MITWILNTYSDAVEWVDKWCRQRREKELARMWVAIGESTIDEADEADEGAATFESFLHDWPAPQRARAISNRSLLEMG